MILMHITKKTADQMGISFDELLSLMHIQKEDYQGEVEKVAEYYAVRNLIIEQLAVKRMTRLTDSIPSIEYIADHSEENMFENVRMYITNDKKEKDLRADALSEKVLVSLLDQSKIMIKTEAIEFQSSKLFLDEE